MHRMYKHKNGILLRKLEEKDLDLLHYIKSESWWGMHGMFLSNSVDQKKWFDSLNDRNIALVAVLPEDKYSLGYCLVSNINWISGTASISGAIEPEMRSFEADVKNSFAAGIDFAFEMLNLQRLEAEVVEFNIPAQKLEIDYLGFKVEGRKRRSVYKNGAYCDSLVLGILREEWAADPRVVALGDCCNTSRGPSKIKKLCERSVRYFKSNEVNS